MLKYMWKIVGGVARQCDLVAKVKIAKFFPCHVGDSQKFMLAKISPYMVPLVVILSCSLIPPKKRGSGNIQLTLGTIN